MNRTTGKVLPIVTALVLSFGLAACADESLGDSEGAGESSLAQQTDASTASATASETRTADAGAERREERARVERGEERDGEHDEGDGEERDGEHDEGDGEEHGEEGEESGVYIARTARWSETRGDAWLQLSFNSASNSFVGRVSNTGNEPLCDVRVEVHLSTGTELGPTERTGVPYGGSINVTLPSGGEEFATWTAHHEMSPCEGQ